MEFGLKKFNFLKFFLQKFKNYQNLRKFNILKVPNLKKIAAINFFCMLNLYYLSKNKKVFSLSTTNEFDYLQNIKNFDIRKKNPKILFLKGFSDEKKEEIESNFQKIHAKYKDLDSYLFDFRKNINSVAELEDLLKNYGYSINDLIKTEDFFLNDENLAKIKEELLKKPFIFLNKYGDVKNYNFEEFNEISKADAIYNYFEKLTILNNKHDLLLLNDYEYAFVIYLDNKQLDYNDETFKIFRKMYFLLNFFNVKFFVATTEHSKFLSSSNLNLKNIYLIKRDNMLSKNNNPSLQIDDQNFEVINLSKEVSKIPIKQEDSKIKFNLL